MKSIFLSAICSLPLIPLVAEAANSNDNTYFAYGDVLYWKRERVDGEMIVSDKATNGNSVLRSSKLVSKFGYKEGFRGGIQYNPTFHWSVEGNYARVDNWSSKVVKKEDPETFFFPFVGGLTFSPFNGSHRFHATAKSRLQSGELSFLYHAKDDRNVLAFSLIGGLRYLHVHDFFGLEMSRLNETGAYTVLAKNDLMGGQIGGKFRTNGGEYFSLELLAKVGGYGNRAFQSTFLGDARPGRIVRDFRPQKWVPAASVETAAQLIFHIFKFFDLKIGYQVLQLYGVALSEEQIDLTTSPQAGSHVKTGGKPVYHGLSAGATLSF